MKQALLGIAVSFFACGSPAKAAPGKPASAMFELGEVTMFDGKDIVFKVHADGSTEMGFRHGKNIKFERGVPWSSRSLPIVLKAGPTMVADGTFLHDGTARVRANADGTFVSLKDQKTVEGLTVANDTIRIAHGGRVVTWTLGADGTLAQHGGNVMSDGPVRIVGADTPGKRRAILSLVALTLYPHKVHHTGEVLPVREIQP
jgi:hypothetical protein